MRLTLTITALTILNCCTLGAFVRYKDASGPVCTTSRRRVASEQNEEQFNLAAANNLNLDTFGRQLQRTSTYAQCDPLGTNDCPSGTLCADTTTGHRCIPSLDAGEECVAAGNQPCGPGLQCVNHRCTPVLLEGTPCGTSTSSSASCAGGLLCAGPPRARRCVKPMGFGGSCLVDPTWVCDKGLVCRYYRCVRALTADCPCDDPASPGMCEAGSVCKSDVITRRSRCVRIRRLDTKQWVFAAASGTASVYLNGEFLEQTAGPQNVAAVAAHVNMGDVVALRVDGDKDWSAFIVAVGAYQQGKPNWAVRSGAHEFLATKAYDDPDNKWMMRDFDACGSNSVWQRVRYAPRDDQVEVGKGKAADFPYWTGARFMWARDVEFGESIFVRFKRGGHKC